MKFIFSSALLALASSPLVGAILPAQVTEGLLENATEVLYISVISVEHIHDEEPYLCWEDLHIDAQVLEVNKSMSGLMGQEVISFDSMEWQYDMDTQTEEVGMDVEPMRTGDNFTMSICEEGPPPGPSIPPELYSGWCGYIYLNAGKDGHLELAAHGDSFVPAEDMSTCPPVDPEATADLDLGHEIHDDEDHEEDHADHDEPEGDEHEDHDHDGDGVQDHAPEDHDDEEQDDHEDHDHDGDGVQDHAPEDHDEEHDEHDDHEDHDHDGDGVQDHASEDHDEEHDDHDDHDHDHDHSGESSGSATCGEACTTQGSCADGKINVCHGGDTNECIAAVEWSSHCSDFGDSCGACAADPVSGANTNQQSAALATAMGGFLLMAL